MMLRNVINEDLKIDSRFVQSKRFITIYKSIGGSRSEVGKLVCTVVSDTYDNRVYMRRLREDPVCTRSV
jgi:hypothetical protein